ncbi:MAG: glycosyl transferase family 1 [Desulfovibrio sp.]|jgi:hypothetical protein|nr:glycosyl transferase family 1 [Desulfovibrio sp.]
MLTGPEVRLAVSLDAEEEGLFAGRYAHRDPPVANTACLARLAPLMALPLRLTLFCAYSVFDNPRARADLGAFLDKFRDGVEIGAHLHHWNTPPLPVDPPAFAADVSTAGIPENVLAAKLANLLAAAGDFCGERPASFRMGRWDIRRTHWPLLARAGIACDASVRPLHGPLRGPDHFAAPAGPYRIPAAGTSIFEVPLTVTPLFRFLPRLLERLPARAPGNPALLARATLNKWGALALLPVHHPLWLMQHVTRLFVARGGTVLSLTWHSSEMMPGGAPRMSDAAAVDGLLHKIYRYIQWVYKNFSARACTMRELAAEMGPCVAEMAAPAGDWTSG